MENTLTKHSTMMIAPIADNKFVAPSPQNRGWMLLPTSLQSKEQCSWNLTKSVIVS